MGVMAEETERELELRDYLDVLRRRKWIVVGVTAIVVAAALGMSLLQDKVYRATAEILLQTRASERIFDPTEGQSNSSDRVLIDTEIQVMRSRSVQAAAEEELGRAPSVSIASRGQTNVVAVSAESTEPAEAAREANTFASVYIDTRREQQVSDLLAASAEVEAKINDIDAQLAALDEDADGYEAQRSALQSQRAGFTSQLGQLELAGNLTRTGGAQLVSQAEEPSAPVSPKPLRNAILALVVGLMLGVGLAFLRDYLDESIRTREDLDRLTGGRLNVLGSIPIVAGWKEGNAPMLIASTEPNAPASEAYRSLRTSVQFIGLDYPIKLLQLTSASAAEGKTTTLANLAVSMSQAGRRVLVVCCDLRRPRVHEFFGLDNKVGFTSVIVGETEVEKAIQEVPGTPRLSLLASGPTPPNPAELLSSARVEKFFAWAREAYDIVLVDSPPVLPVTDGAIIARLADATVVVATAGVTGRRELQRTLESLETVQANVVGAVLNGIEIDRGNYYRYGYGYAAKSG
jgi:succinoglycan biosynthesis transport protein ExoP